MSGLYPLGAIANSAEQGRRDHSEHPGQAVSTIKG
jgi:hypothetical protein